MKTLSKPIPFITLSDDDSNFCISPDATEYLKSITGDIAIISIAGLYRTGKSYLLNLLLGRQQSNDMFGVGGTVNAFTKGIWLWGEPLEVSNKKMTVVFMDTEGLGSMQRSQTQDTRIFALALLLSSYFMYNSRGVIDSSAIDDLSLVVNLTKYISVKANQEAGDGDDSGAEFAQYFPSFMWIVRDFTLQLLEDGKKISSRDYLENALKPQGGFSDGVAHKNHVRMLLCNFFPDRDCTTLVRPLNDEELLRDLVNQPYDSLRPEFRKQVETLKTKVFANLKPKQLMSKPLNGAMLVTLAETFVNAFNSGETPVISNAWDRVISCQCEDALVKACDEFEKYVQSHVEQLYRKDAAVVGTTKCALPLAEDELDGIILEARSVAQGVLSSCGITDPTTLDPFRTRLRETILTSARKYIELNEEVSRNYCLLWLNTLQMPTIAKVTDDADLESELSGIKRNLLEYKSNIDNVVRRYDSEAKGPCADAVLGEFLSKKLVDGVVDWGSQVSALFRRRNNTLQKEIDAKKQKLRAIEGKTKATEEIHDRQKESYEKALQAASERLADERKLLREEAASKQSEIDRLANQVDQLTKANMEAITRIDIQLVQARETIRAIEERVEKERERREMDVKGASRELLESERVFHKEEKNLMQSQHALLQKVVDLQRQLGEQKAAQLKECLTLEQEGKDKLSSLEAEYETKQEALKAQTIMDIRSLKTTQDALIKEMETELSDKRATLEAMNEVIKGRRPSETIAPLTGKPIPGTEAIPVKKSDDCTIQ